MKSQDTTPQPDSLTVKPFQISPFQTRKRSETEDQIIYGKKGPLKTHPLFRKGLRASSRSPARAPLAVLVSP